MSRTVLCFGELLWDLFPTGPEPGGAPSNFAYRLHSLGREPIIVSKVGDDEHGHRALALLKEKGLRTDFIQIDSKLSTGIVNVTLSPDGEPGFYIVPNVAYDAIEFTPALAGLARKSDCVCFGTLAQRSALSQQTLLQVLDHADSATRVLDINLRKDCYTIETIRRSLSETDILKLNESELRELGRLLGVKDLDEPTETETEALWYLASMIEIQFGFKTCVVTRGERGSLALKFEHHDEESGSTHTTEGCEHPSYPIEVQDTCGSGDAFTAAFVHKYLDGASLGECSAYGNALGALVAQTKGGMAPVSTQQIDELLRTKVFRQ